MKKIDVASFVLLIPVLAVLSFPALAFEAINKSYFGDLALGGYDAVSYFTDQKALKGDEAHTVTWKGARWLFSSDRNRQLFEASPQTFAPQYGGYCSNQMSLGNLSDIDPNVWRVIDGKLYLFGHEAGRIRWQDHTRNKISDADGYWREYLAR